MEEMYWVLPDANLSEMDVNASEPVIDMMEEQKKITIKRWNDALGLLPLPDTSRIFGISHLWIPP